MGNDNKREQDIAMRIERMRACDYSFDELLMRAAQAERGEAFFEAVCEQQSKLLDVLESTLSYMSASLPPLLAKEVEEKIAEAKSDLGKYAVSLREDQIQKPRWIEHCAKAKNSGAAINRLEDLLNIEGYDPAITKVSQRQLKAWAKEAGITLKAGRPPSK